MYPTPQAAVMPLLPFLPQEPFTFVEPCFGDGALTRHLEQLTSGKMVAGIDIDPQPYEDSFSHNVMQASSLLVNSDILASGDMIITNPPWDRSKKSGYIMHKMIERFSDLRPTWLLFDSDWLYTNQAAPFMENLVCTVAVGRVKWIEGSTMTGKDNCQWSLFSKHARKVSPAPYIFGKGISPAPGIIGEIYAKTMV